MRYFGDHPGYFADDTPNGMLIECQGCKHTHEDTTEWGEPTICPSCKKELYYPPGASW